MKVITISDIEKKDIPLHYRNEYKGIANLDFTTRTQKRALEFTIERSAIGTVDISVSLLEDIDYPLIPVIKTLKEHILFMEKEGLLP